MNLMVKNSILAILFVANLSYFGYKIQTHSFWEYLKDPVVWVLNSAISVIIIFEDKK